MAVRYTVCTYYPDLKRTETACPFAVLASSAKDIALVGVNVADAYASLSKHPLAKSVARQTFGIVEQSIQRAMRQPGVRSCFDALDRIVERNFSNIQYRSFIEVEADEATKVADLVFSGMRQQWATDSSRDVRQEVLRFHQVLLRVDDQDLAAITSGMPGYAVFGLRCSAAELVRSPQVMYRGLRREGRMRQGFALCGRLQHAFDNAGEAMATPPGMVFIVYADPDGYVF